ncbi:unnamed protein product [Timema podura]|uniref:Uncharacterized protein n=1 Tax=Timema podura TaxID=61482 RepID=A0ABN7NIJ9_TIMPD|nr:unnamed protein product [Timema podura]
MASLRSGGLELSSSLRPESERDLESLLDIDIDLERDLETFLEDGDLEPTLEPDFDLDLDLEAFLEDGDVEPIFEPDFDLDLDLGAFLEDGDVELTLEPDFDLDLDLEPFLDDGDFEPTLEPDLDLDLDLEPFLEDGDIELTLEPDFDLDLDLEAFLEDGDLEPDLDLDLDLEAFLEDGDLEPNLEPDFDLDLDLEAFLEDGDVEPTLEPEFDLDLERELFLENGDFDPALDSTSDFDLDREFFLEACKPFVDPEGDLDPAFELLFDLDLDFLKAGDLDPNLEPDFDLDLEREPFLDPAGDADPAIDPASDLDLDLDRESLIDAAHLEPCFDPASDFDLDRLDPDGDLEPILEPDLDLDLEREPFLDPDADLEPDLDLDLDREPFLDPDGDIEPAFDLGMDLDLDLDREPFLDPDGDLDLECVPCLEREGETDPAFDLDADLDLDTDLESDLEREDADLADALLATDAIDSLSSSLSTSLSSIGLEGVSPRHRETRDEAALQTQGRVKGSLPFKKSVALFDLKSVNDAASNFRYDDSATWNYEVEGMAAIGHSAAIGYSILRLRNLIQVIGYNVWWGETLETDKKQYQDLNRSDSSAHTNQRLKKPRTSTLKTWFYYTLHLTTMSAPFYTSEKLESDNPKWAEIDVGDLVSIVVRLWCHREGVSEQALTVWGVYFSGLTYLGPNLCVDPTQFHRNTVVFHMYGGYFTAHQCIKETPNKERKTKVTLNASDVHPSYNVNLLLRLHTIQQAIKKQTLAAENLRNKISVGGFTNHESQESAVLRRLLNKSRPKAPQREVMLKVKREVELVRFRVHMLAAERARKNKELLDLEKTKHLLVEANQDRKLMDQYQNLNKEMKHFKEWKKIYIDTRESLLHSNAQLTYLCGVHLPNSEDFIPNEEVMISVALGFVAHLVQMISVFLQVPLRYPIVHFGSRSKIIDHMADKIPDKDREQVSIVLTGKRQTAI